MTKSGTRRYFGAFAMSAALALLCVIAGSSVAVTGDTTRVSVDDSGAQANRDSSEPSISADGRYVAFESLATNLVPNDTNNGFDVFVHDLTAGTTERVSLDSSGNQASGSSFEPSINSNGRYVAFDSHASLVAGDTGGTDVFVRDRTAGTTERVSVDDSGAQANSESYSPSISADGRYVAFHSQASDLVPNDTNGTYDVFVRDRQTGTTERVNVDGSGAQENINSGSASISADGRYVAFVTGDADHLHNIFVRDRTAGTTERVSVDSSGNLTDDDSYIPSISADGRYVAFLSYASNLVVDDTNGLPDVFVHDRADKKTERVSVSSCGRQANNGTFTGPSISADGRYVAFNSLATNLIADDTNGRSDTFVRDWETGTTQRVSVSSSGIQANGHSFNEPSISSEGRYVAFFSSANTLVSNDTNNVFDVFVHERRTAQPNDCIAPTSTASAATHSGADYEQGAWTTEDVEVRFSAQDNEGGSGLKDISYSATGAQGIPQTVYDQQNAPVINTEGTTTISYFATDNAGNRESPTKTFTVKLDKSAPILDTDSSDGTDGIKPNNKETGVRRNIQPKGTFSDEMDADSLTTSATLYQWNAKKKVWRPVPAAVSVEGKTATLDPYPTDTLRLLAANKKFKVTVTTSAKNLAGLPLESPKSWTFTTGSR